MTCSMVVNSKSGNTRMVSGAIKRALAVEGASFIHAAAIGDNMEPDQLDAEAAEASRADTVLVGFWCDKGTCTPAVAGLLSRLHGKRVFIFGTCGFGASEEYFKQIIDRVTSNLPMDAELLGWSMCQGKMGPAVRERYEAMLEDNPEDERARMLIANYDVAKSHPTKEDLEHMSEAAIKAILSR